MKNIVSILVLLTLFTSTSCEKVIDLKIEDSEKKVVIEAELYNGTNQFEVIVSQSSFYNDLESNTPIENATVTLTDNQGVSTNIPHASSGIYSELISASAGVTYTLTVTIDGETYQASSSMQAGIPITSLTTEYVAEPPFGGNPGTRVHYQFTDPAGTENFYRKKFYVQNAPMNSPSDLAYFNDNLSDGQDASRLVSRKLFQSGQTVRVELIHIDEDTYNYLFTLGDIIGSSYTPSAAPSNPITNWSNGALGVFSTYNSDTMSIVIP